ncbi:MAG: ComF family protein [Bacteroidales bacterium]|nr:ComF family protein [Bacteroidales bacterium]
MWLNDFIKLFFPELCKSCGTNLLRNEKYICTTCLSELPFTNYHKYIENPVHQIFWGRIKIEFATSLFYFSKHSKVQTLLHRLKYEGDKSVGYFLGELLGQKLSESSFFNDVNYIVPVPLHPKKIIRRGYNQSQIISEGISKIINKPVANIIERITETQTQTKKTRIERWTNVSDVFRLKIIDKEKYYNKHFLIVDDVITTGATIEACANTLISLENAKVSVATIAKA